MSFKIKYTNNKGEVILLLLLLVFFFFFFFDKMEYFQQFNL